MHRDIGDQAGQRPLVLGLGCERGTPCGEVIRLAENALRLAGLDRRDLTGIASLDTRAAEPAMLAAATHFFRTLSGLRCRRAGGADVTA